jgi:hypothetical protein
MRLLVLTLALLAGSVATAEAALFEIPRVLREDLRRVAPKTDVPIRLPATMRLDFPDPVFGAGGGTKSRYDFSINATDDCGGANACFLASFTGQKGGSYAFAKRVSLANGITGRYKPLSCGASCSPPTIEWKQRGHLYRLQAKLAVSGRTKQRRAMVRAANSAIRSAPR